MSSGESVVAFRDATLSDVPAVMKLVHSAYRGMRAGRAGRPKRTCLTETGLTRAASAT